MSSKQAKSNERTFSHGSCSYERTQPSREVLSKDTAKLNVIISFEEALKLNLALQDWLFKANRVKRSTKEGKLAAANLVVDLDGNNISVVPGKLLDKKA